ncbi:B3 domain-containing protein Os03g0212300-like [Punica granatum]|uniref:B3 domain-containing protein Os03g0212300-like n=1 Tax=Punica granatum TaxID=22663 RepID=A0A6P8EMV0_PUNGR|nr:B3 domain-containing protein Os03g0212300-like [Punica granatum]
MSTSKKPTFFKIFLPEQSARRMRIPPAYRKHMKGKSSGYFYLKGPSGYYWPVKLIEESSNLFLTRGWPAFVKDHDIHHGHFLLFKFDGETTLKVKVFSHTACEDKAAFSAKPSGGDGNNNPPNPVKALVAKVKKEEDAWDRLVKAMVQAGAPSTATNPHFALQLKAYSVQDRGRGKTLVIPSSFAKIHFVKPKTPIVLQWEDKEWPATVNKSLERSYLRGGWGNFLKESKVQEGDTCKFELLEPSVLRVHILKLIEEEYPDQ